MKKSFFICLVSFVTILQCNSQIITDRPDQTESSSTVGYGNLQIESGLLIGVEGENRGAVRQILAPTNLFRYGITKNVEIRLLSQYETLKNSNISYQGMSDIEVGTKIQILQNPDINTEIAFLTHVVIPTGTKELTNDDWGTINKLSIAHDINDRSSVGYNIGYNYFGQNNGDLTYSLALGVAINERVGIYIEPYGELADFEEFILNFDTGITYLINENLQLDFSFGTGVNQKMNYISVGASWLILNDKNSANK